MIQMKIPVEIEKIIDFLNEVLYDCPINQIYDRIKEQLKAHINKGSSINLQFLGEPLLYWLNRNVLQFVFSAEKSLIP